MAASPPRHSTTTTTWSKLTITALSLILFTSRVSSHNHHSHSHSKDDNHNNRPHAGISFGPDLDSISKVKELNVGFDGMNAFGSSSSKGGKKNKGFEAVGFDDAVKVAVEYAEGKLFSRLSPPSAAMQVHSLTVTDAYTSDHSGVTHVYFVQSVDGVEVVNAVANANVGKDGKVMSFHSKFYEGTDLAKSGDDGLVVEKDDDDDEDDEGALRRRGHQRGGDKHHKKNFGIRKGKAFTDKKMNKHGKHGKSESSKKSFLDTTKNNKGQVLLTPIDALVSLGSHLGVKLNPQDLTLIPSQNLSPNKPRDEPDYIITLSSHTSLKPSSTGKIPKGVPASLRYIQTSTGKLQISWDLQLDLFDNWFHAIVDASDGTVLSLVDWVSDASYNVYPIGTNDPLDGERELVVDPAHWVSSPHGWHYQGGSGKAKGKNFTVTVGNNVYAHENLNGRNDWEDKIRPDGKTDLVFNFPANLSADPSTYLDAAVTNLFYWNNAIHDLFYIYGFDEKAGNFQEDNLGRGGKGGDAVIANAQDGSGYNNANFATPPDGGHGRMRMYVWDVTDPMRDGDFEGGIILHEYAHGISIRLTGGPANSGCLGWGEAGGMGEGWGDFFATILRMTPNSTRKNDFGMGEYANGGDGIRKYRYSTSMTTNPSTYAYISRPGYWGVHAKGEVWAVILYEVYWNLVEKHGFNPDWYDTPMMKGKLPLPPVPPVEPVPIPTPSPAADGNGWNGADSEYFREFKSGKKVRRVWDPTTVKKGGKKEKFIHGGNVLALQLVVDGLKLQPCLPSFVDARDAILEADEGLTGGDNKCEIWKGFAKRGLGEGAASGGRESFKVPQGC
ncbi:Fungalysin/Thermolysin Extracellular metalloproteinase 5 [Blyttiomyces sp. JEL0837]|nr:Fungalysin/Thermolysin Extracellular metalloproteinase 5 [Blyttiomyces sp. JEL0837]